MHPQPPQAPLQIGAGGREDARAVDRPRLLHAGAAPRVQVRGVWRLAPHLAGEALSTLSRAREIVATRPGVVCERSEREMWPFPKVPLGGRERSAVNVYPSTRLPRGSRSDARLPMGTNEHHADGPQRLTAQRPVSGMPRPARRVMLERWRPVTHRARSAPRRRTRSGCARVGRGSRLRTIDLTSHRKAAV